MTAPLTRDEIVTLDDRPIVIFDVPEWGQSVRLRALSLRQTLALEAAGQEGVQQSLAILQGGIVGEDGQPCLSAADAEALLDKRPGAINRLAIAIMDMSKMLKAEDGAGK